MFTGSTLAAVSEAVSASNAQSAYWSSLESASTVAVSALSHTGALIRSLMRSRLHGEAPLLLTNPYVSTFGYKGAPSDLLCAHRSNQPRQNQTFSQTTRPDRSENSHFCLFHIPSSLTARLNSQRSEVVQVLFGIDGALESFPLLTAADPPISTSLVAMELTTLQGQPIPIEDLEPEQAIRVTLPNRYPVGQENRGEAMTRTCSTVTVPTEGQLSFMVQALDDLYENAGLYLSFNFSLAPGKVDYFFFPLFLFSPEACSTSSGFTQKFYCHKAGSNLIDHQITYVTQLICTEDLIKTAQPLKNSS